MKAKIHDCEKCINFIPPVPLEPENLISDISKAGCTAGHEILFRMPERAHLWTSKNCGGWFRYCNDF